MTARWREDMRRLVDNAVESFSSGEVSANAAAQKLHENGVPVSVIGRVIGGAVVNRTTAPKGDASASAGLLDKNPIKHTVSHATSPRHP